MSIFNKVDGFVERLHESMLVNPARTAGWLRVLPSDRPANFCGRFFANTKIFTVSWISGAVRVVANSVMAVANLVVALVSPIFLQLTASRNAFSRLGGNIKQIGHGLMLSTPLINVLWMKCFRLHAGNTPVNVSTHTDNPAEQVPTSIEQFAKVLSRDQLISIVKCRIPVRTQLGWGSDRADSDVEITPRVWEKNQPGKTVIETLDGPVLISENSKKDLTRITKLNGKDTPGSENRIPHIYREISQTIPSHALKDQKKKEIVVVAMAALHQAFWAPNLLKLMELTDCAIGDEKNSQFYDHTFVWSDNCLLGTAKRMYTVCLFTEPTNPLFKVAVTRHFHVNANAEAVADGETYEIVDIKPPEAPQTL